MKTCRKMSIETIGVYSDADKRSLHTKFADKAYHIGAAPSLESYLNIDKIVNTAIKARCQVCCSFFLNLDLDGLYYFKIWVLFSGDSSRLWISK